MKHFAYWIPCFLIVAGSWAETAPGLTPPVDTLPPSAHPFAQQPSVDATPMKLTPQDAELIANAHRVDEANQQLLAEKQKNLLEIEELQTQVAVLRNDQSSEGIREGALAVIAGFVLGWLSGKSKRKGW